MSSDNHKILQEARAEIDSVDDQILELLIQREVAVSKVSEAKGGGKAGGNPVRFEREAQILRRLHRNHTKSGAKLPFMAVVRIWHELIAAYTLLQNPYQVTVSGVSLDLARQQFGDCVDMVDADFHGEGTPSSRLWVLPHPKESNWWLDIGHFNILACLPFVHDGDKNSEPLAYVVGDCATALSSDDGSLDVLCFMIECESAITLDDNLIDILAKEDLCAIAVSGNHLYCERHASLSGDLEAHIKQWQSLDGIKSIKPLGIYPKPLKIE